MGNFQFLIYSTTKIFMYGCEPSPLYNLQQDSSVFSSDVNASVSFIIEVSNDSNGMLSRSFSRPSDGPVSRSESRSNSRIGTANSRTRSSLCTDSFNRDPNSLVSNSSMASSVSSDCNESQSFEKEKQKPEKAEAGEGIAFDDELEDEKEPTDYFYFSEFDILSLIDLSSYAPARVSSVMKISSDSTRVFVGFSDGVVRLFTYDLAVTSVPSAADSPRVVNVKTNHLPPRELFSFVAHFDNAAVGEMVLCNSGTNKNPDFLSSLYSYELITSGQDGRLCHWGFQCVVSSKGLVSVFEEVDSSLDGSLQSSVTGKKNGVNNEVWSVDLLGEQILPSECLYVDVAIPKEQRVDHKKSKTVRVPMNQSIRNLQLFAAGVNAIDTYQLCICNFGGLLLVYELTQPIQLLRGSSDNQSQLTLANRGTVGTRQYRVPSRKSAMQWSTLSTWASFGPTSMIQDCSEDELLRVQQTLLVLQDDNSVSLMSVESGELLRQITLHISSSAIGGDASPVKILQQVIDTKKNHYHVDYLEPGAAEVLPEATVATTLTWCDYSRNIVVGYQNGCVCIVYFTVPAPTPTDGAPVPSTFHMRSNGIGNPTVPVALPGCRKVHTHPITFITSYRLQSLQYLDDVLYGGETNGRMHNAVRNNVYVVVGDSIGTISIWLFPSYSTTDSSSRPPKLLYHYKLHQGSISNCHVFSIPWMAMSENPITKAGKDRYTHDYTFPREKVNPTPAAISVEEFKAKKLKEHHEFFIAQNHKKHHLEEKEATYHTADFGATKDTSTDAPVIPPCAVLMMSSCTNGLVCMWNMTLEGKMELISSINAHISGVGRQMNNTASLSSSCILSSTSLWPFIVHKYTDKAALNSESVTDIFVDPKKARYAAEAERDMKESSKLLTASTKNLLDHDKPNSVPTTLHTLCLCGYDNGEIRSFKLDSSNSSLTTTKGVATVLHSEIVSSSKINGIKIFLPTVDSSLGSSLPENPNHNSSYDNHYSKVLGNCAEVVTHCCQDHRSAEDISHIHSLAAVCSTSGIVWLVRLFGNGHVECLHRFNVNLCPRSTIVGKNQYQHHQVANSSAANSSGTGSSGYMYTCLHMLLRELLAQSNDIGSAMENNLEGPDAYSVDDGPRKPITRTIEAVCVHPNNISKILLTVNQEKLDKLPEVWRNPPAPAKSTAPLVAPQINPSFSHSPGATPTGFVSNSNSNVVSRFHSADEGSSSSNVLDLNTDAEAVAALQSISPKSTGKSQTKMRIDVDAAAHLIKNSESGNQSRDDPFELTLPAVTVHTKKPLRRTRSSGSVRKSRGKVKSSSPGGERDSVASSDAVTTVSSAASIGGAHREMMMVELHLAKKDLFLLEKFTQHEATSNASITLDGAVNVVYEWLVHSTKNDSKFHQKLFSEDLIWGMVELLGIDNNGSLSFLDVAKISAIVSSAVGHTITPNLKSATSKRAAKTYRSMKTSTTKVYYNAMGERVVEKVPISKKLSDGLPDALCSAMRRMWAEQEPRVVTAAALSASQPAAPATVLRSIPKSFRKLLNKAYIKIPDLWQVSSLARSKPGARNDDDNEGYIHGGEDYWLSLRRAMRIARTILNMRSTWQHTFMLYGKEGKSLSKLVLNPHGSGHMSDHPMMSTAEFVLKYFERYFGTSNLFVAHQKVQCFLEACVQYIDYPVLHSMVLALDLLPSAPVVPLSPSQLAQQSSNNLGRVSNMVEVQMNRKKVDKECSLWLYIEMRDLLYSRNLVLLGDVVPFNEDDCLDDRSLSSSKKQHNIDVSGGEKMHVSSRDMQEVHWLLLRRSDAILCTDYMFRSRGRFGPNFIDAIIKRVYSLPAVAGENMLLQTLDKTKEGVGIISTVARDMGAELIDCEAFLELIMMEYLANQQKTENLYDDVYYRYLKNNEKITIATAHEINSESGTLDTDGSIGSDGSTDASPSKSGTAGSYFGSSKFNNSVTSVGTGANSAGSSRFFGEVSFEAESKVDILRVSMMRIDNLCREFIVQDPQRTGCLDFLKFEYIMNAQVQECLGNPSDELLKELISLCVSNYRVVIDGSICYLDFWAILMAWLMESHGEEKFSAEVAVKVIKTQTKGLEENHVFALIAYLGHIQCPITYGTFWMCKDVTHKALLHFNEVNSASYLHRPITTVGKVPEHVALGASMLNTDSGLLLPLDGNWHTSTLSIPTSSAALKSVDDLVNDLKKDGIIKTKDISKHRSDPIEDISYGILKISSVTRDGDIESTYGAGEMALPIDGSAWRMKTQESNNAPIVIKDDNGEHTVTGRGSYTGVYEGIRLKDQYVPSTYVTSRDVKTLYGEVANPVARAHNQELAISSTGSWQVVSEEPEAAVDERPPLKVFDVSTLIDIPESKADPSGGVSVHTKVSKPKSGMVERAASKHEQLRNGNKKPPSGRVASSSNLPTVGVALNRDISSPYKSVTDVYEQSMLSKSESAPEIYRSQGAGRKAVESPVGDPDNPIVFPDTSHSTVNPGMVPSLTQYDAEMVRVYDEQSEEEVDQELAELHKGGLLLEDEMEEMNNIDQEKKNLVQPILSDDLSVTLTSVTSDPSQPPSAQGAQVLEGDSKSTGAVLPTSPSFFAPKNASATLLGEYYYGNSAVLSSNGLSAVHSEVFQTQRSVALIEAEKRRLQAQLHENEARRKMFGEKELLMKRRKALLLKRAKERQIMLSKERESTKKMIEANEERYQRNQRYKEMEAKIKQQEEEDKLAAEMAEMERISAAKDRKAALKSQKEFAEAEEERLRLEKLREHDERKYMEAEEKSGENIRTLIRREIRALEKAKEELAALARAESNERYHMNLEEERTRAVLLHEWEWKRRKEEWKDMRQNDYNVKPTPPGTPVKEENVESGGEESASEQEGDDEDLNVGIGGDDLLQNALNAAAGSDDESEFCGSRTQMTLHAFLKKVARANDGNSKHPRKERGDVSNFFMPLEFTDDIHYLPFDQENPQFSKIPLPKRASPPPVVKHISQSRRHRRGANSKSFDKPVEVPVHPVKMVDNENTRMCKIVDDMDGAEPNNDFSFITGAVKTHKKKLAKERSNQLYRTSNNDVPPDEWTHLVLKSAVNWTRYFEMDREERLAIEAANSDTEEQRRLRQEELFLNELEHQSTRESGHDDLDPADLRVGDDTLMFSESVSDVGGMRAQTFSLENLMRSTSNSKLVSPRGGTRMNTASKFGGMTAEEVNQLPPLFLEELKQLAYINSDKGAVKPLPLAHVEKAVVKRNAYKYFQIEVLNNDDAIVTIELKCLYGDADIYVALQDEPVEDSYHPANVKMEKGSEPVPIKASTKRIELKLPSTSNYDYCGRSSGSDSKTVRLVVPLSALTPVVHTHHYGTTKKQNVKYSIRTILVSVYSPYAGAMFSVWAYATSDPNPQDCMSRVDKYVRAFDILTGHYSSEELWNNLPKALSSAKNIAEAEKQADIAKAMRNNVFNQVAAEMNLIPKRKDSIESVDSTTKEECEFEHARQAELEENMRKGIKSDSDVIGALQSMLRTKKLDLTPTETPRPVLTPMDVHQERKERDLDEEDIYNLESHVAKAGRNVMRGRLAEAVNLPRTHTRPPSHNGATMDIADIGGAVTGGIHRGSESMSNLPSCGSSSMTNTKVGGPPISHKDITKARRIDIDDIEDPNNHADLYFKLKVPTSAQLFKEVAPQGAVDRYNDRLAEENSVVHNAISAISRAYSRSGLLDRSSSNLNGKNRPPKNNPGPLLHENSVSNIPTLPAIPGSEATKNETKPRSKMREELINKVLSANINPNPVNYTLKHVKLAELPGKKLHPTVSKNSLI